MPRWKMQEVFDLPTLKLTSNTTGDAVVLPAFTSGTRLANTYSPRATVFQTNARLRNL
jgi:hypothetical protein